jgi:hypothetical protein
MGSVDIMTSDAVPGTVHGYDHWRPNTCFLDDAGLQASRRDHVSPLDACTLPSEASFGLRDRRAAR